MDESVTILAVLIAAVLGGLLIALGRRGRRVDDAPLCRRCGYDVSGRPGGSDLCSECGADLTTRRAIRIGHRVRRTYLVVIGALLLFILSAIGFHSRERIRNLNWVQFEPTNWLLRTVRTSHDLAARDRAASELSNRAEFGMLSEAELRAATAIALDIQGDTRKPWMMELGDIVEAAYRFNQLSSEDWQRFSRQAVAFKLEARQQIAAGEPLMIEVRHTDRCGTQFFWMPECVFESLAVDGHAVDVHSLAFTNRDAMLMGVTSGDVFHILPIALDTPPGETVITANVSVSIRELSLIRNGDSAERRAPYTCKLESHTRVVPASQIALQELVNESLRAAVRRALRPVCVEADDHSIRKIRYPHLTTPIAVCYRVFARLPNHSEHEFDRCVVEGSELVYPRSPFWLFDRSFQGTGHGLDLYAAEASVNAPDHLDVVFRVDRQAARLRSSDAPIWGEDEVFKDVPVVRISR